METQQLITEEPEVQENVQILSHDVVQFSKQQPITTGNPQDQQTPLSHDNRSSVVHPSGHVA